MPPELELVADHEPQICPWGTETTVIRHIRFIGKWVQFWVEGTDTSTQTEMHSYDYASKWYVLNRAIEAAGLSDRVKSRGHIGLGVVRRKVKDSTLGAFEILRVFEAIPHVQP